MSYQTHPVEKRAAPAGVEHIIEEVRKMKASMVKLPSERELANQLNVKRHQLRKALTYLRQTNEIESAAPRQTNSALTRYSEELVRLTNPVEVIELRLMIEPGLARLASLRASSRELSRITSAASTPDGADSSDIDLAFHCAVAEAARNDLANELYTMLRQIGIDARLRVTATESQMCPKRIALRDAEHMKVANAIAERNPDAAEAAMREHLQSVSKQIHERSLMSTSRP